MSGTSDWTVPPSFQTVPPFLGPNDPGIAFGTDPIPQAVIDTMHGQFGATMDTVAVVLYQKDSSNYWFDALGNDNTNHQVVIARGFIGPVHNISQFWFFDLITASTSLGLATGPFDGGAVIGNAASAIIRVLSDPLDRIELDAIKAVRTMLNGVEKFRVDSTAGVQVPLDVGWQIDGVAAPRGPRDANLCTAGSVAAVTNVSGEKAIPSASYTNEPTITVNPGHLIKATLSLHAFQSAITESWTKVRLRAGAQSIVGNILGTWQLDLPAIGGSGGGTALARTLVTYITNATGVAVNTKLSITNQWGAGAATIQLYGDVAIPIRLALENLGSVTANPGYSAASVA